MLSRRHQARTQAVHHACTLFKILHSYHNAKLHCERQTPEKTHTTIQTSELLASASYNSHNRALLFQLSAAFYTTIATPCIISIQKGHHGTHSLHMAAAWQPTNTTERYMTKKEICNFRRTKSHYSSIGYKNGAKLYIASGTMKSLNTRCIACLPACLPSFLPCMYVCTYCYLRP
jgi:hypothetical protein